ncbi:hypothetical protein E2562_032459 [Oryza meyeriana var. granulata]|uniref:Uncharacterized protein n=1 Tax=Oryza meyeriana var. granulata TaxID=110450 RepID=A0A6G1FEX6_9ORYZ|nr:hypothetical protein E2562_032459 [Oryza meyeriana var. granulata]
MAKGSGRTPSATEERISRRRRGAVAAAPPGGVPTWKVGSLAWALLCLVADVVVVSALVIERFRLGKASMVVTAVMSSMPEDAVPGPMDMC